MSVKMHASFSSLAHIQQIKTGARQVAKESLAWVITAAVLSFQ